MANTSADKENGAAKKSNPVDNKSSGRKRKRIDSVLDAPDQSDGKDTKIGTSGAQPVHAPKKRARVGRKANDIPTNAKQKGRKTKQDCSEELVDMTEWMAPNSLGNSSSLWRPKNKAREEQIALGPSVYAAVKAERAAHRSAVSKPRVGPVAPNATLQRSAEDRKRNAAEVYAAWEAEKAAIADLISERGKFIAKKLLSSHNAWASSDNRTRSPNACESLAPIEMSNDKAYNQTSESSNASSEEIPNVRGNAAYAGFRVVDEVVFEQMLKACPNLGGLEFRMWEDKTSEVKDGPGDKEESSL
ncbi:hypothetical protein CERZMDRAFT_86546 [Cercospora zeae-maydis SCOH1-5]|uniref:Uncharacterized protein n=1 Tax=Cercospora zeae-maydis SCOH1-5 TaxID=717836 RepID=A0A6A6F933_9PEZI|nr:hypothetical protein CERZMDRAFT_86546 [Cercospora zeae-maydis SCOH1-5]